jgi:ATP/maltotriose-dependent transcriptional regulator MalT
MVRPRLVERLARAGEYPVTVVVAPPGFGKSVAVRQFLDEVECRHLRFVVRPEHASLLAFARGFIEAVSPQNASTTDSAFANTRSSNDQPKRLAFWAAGFLAEANQTIFIDDLQKARNGQVADQDISLFLTTLVESTTARVRWILATRDPLDLPLASWVAAGLSDLAIDEIELELTQGEAQQIVASLNLSLSDLDVSAVFGVAKGLPFAFSMALSIWRNNENAIVAVDATRKRINHFLNEHVFGGLDAGIRSFLLKTALFRELSTERLTQAGWPNAGDIIATLRRETFCISEDSNGVFRHHDLFQEFLEEQLRAQGAAAFWEAYQSARSAHEVSGNFDRAIDLASEIGDGPTVLILLREHAATFFDLGSASVLERAVRSLDEATLEGSAAALYALGLVERLHGRGEEAVRRLREALRLASDRPMLVALISLALSGQLGDLQRLDEEAEVLETASAVRSGDPEIDFRVESARCASKVLSGRCDVEAADVAGLRAMLERSENKRTQLDLLHSLTLMMEQSGAFEQARTYATQVFHIAVEQRLPTAAAVAANEMHNVARELGESNEAIVWALRAADYAQKAGHVRIQCVALMAVYGLYVEAGDVDAALAAEQRLLASGTLDPAFAFGEYVPGRALALAGAQGSAQGFQEAAAWLSQWLEDTSWSSFRGPEMDYDLQSRFAVYYAAAGIQERARALLGEGEQRVHGLPGSLRSRRHRYEGHVWSALAYVLLHEPEPARELLDVVDTDQSSLRPRTVNLWGAVEQIYRMSLCDVFAESEGLGRCCEQLRAAALGGYAAMFEALLPLLEGAR